MPAKNGKNNGARRGNGRRNRSNQSGPSRAPATTLKRTFRYFQNVQLNNTTGTGLDQYAYYSTYLLPKPELCTGFKDCQKTFEFFKINRMRVKAQPSYNAYNQTYNTINLDSVAAMQIWTASDFSTNENISGTSILSYNNARVHTLSLNGVKTVVNTAVRINQNTLAPRTILPSNSWLDTSTDFGTQNIYSGAQFFAKMPGVSATNYLPEIQLIIEIDCEFKQPGYQNRSTSFESDIVGATLSTIPDASSEDRRVYKVVSYTIDGTGNDYRLEREDGQPGSLNYSEEEFWEVYFYRTSGSYFGNRQADYTGPIPRRPQNWEPSQTSTPCPLPRVPIRN